MRKPALVLIAIVAAVVLIALTLRLGSPDDPTTTTLASSTSFSAETTTSLSPPTTVRSSTLPPGTTVCDLYEDIATAGTIDNADLVEASGLASSRSTDDVLWAHNDSRGGPILYAFRPTGVDLGSFEIPGAFSLDWEDMSAGPGWDGEGAFLYVGDIGDNFDIRAGLVTVYRVPDLDPAVMEGQFPEATANAYRYPDQGHNAEALFIDPREPALYLVTKDRTESVVYRGSLEPSDEPITLELVTVLSLGEEVSAADMSADGSTLALRGYRDVWLWHRNGDETVSEMLAVTPCATPSPDEVQGESITFDGSFAYWTISEGSHPSINLVERLETDN